MHRRLTEVEIQGLFQQLINGVDAEYAAKRIYQEFFSVLVFHARRYLDNDELAREVVQEVMLFVLTKPEQFKGDSKVSTWLHSITQYKAIDRVRATKTERASRVDWDDEVHRNIPDPDWNFLGRIDDKKLLDLVNDCFSLLPPSHQMTVQLMCAEEMTESEAAEVLDCPKGTIKSRLSIARSKIRACVEAALRGNA